MTKYKIIDYSYPTAGELARLILAYKGVEYEDYQVETPDEIYEAEEAAPFGLLPILLVDGEPVAQVQGICRYLSTELGLTGRNNKEAAICDMIMDSLGNMFYQFRLDQVSKLDPEEQLKMIKKMMTEDVPRYLQMYERFLEKENHKSGYLASEDLTWCDLGVALTFAGMQIRQPNVLTNYPRLQNFVTKVTSNDVVSEFIQKRHMPKETTTSV